MVENFQKKINFVEEFNNYILLTVPTRFIRDWITSRYLDQILQIIRGHKKDIIRIEFKIADLKTSNEDNKKEIVREANDEKNEYKVGDKVVVMPAREGTGVKGEVKTIEMHHEQVQEAEPGDNVGFSVRGINKKDIARGDVLGHEDNIPNVVSEFTAQIVVLNHPTALPVGYTPVFHIHTAQASAKFIEIQKKLDPKTGATVEENPKFLKTGDAAIVKVKPLQPLCVEEYKQFPHLGRFAIRDMGQTVAAGIILSVTPK